MKLYTLKQAAKFLSKSRQWVWFLIQAKRIEFDRIGNQYVISEDQLIRYKSNVKQ